MRALVQQMSDAWRDLAGYAEICFRNGTMPFRILRGRKIRDDDLQYRGSFDVNVGPVCQNDHLPLYLPGSLH